MCRKQRKVTDFKEIRHFSGPEWPIIALWAESAEKEAVSRFSSENRENLSRNSAPGALIWETGKMQFSRFSRSFESKTQKVDSEGGSLHDRHFCSKSWLLRNRWLHQCLFSKTAQNGKNGVFYVFFSNRWLQPAPRVDTSAASRAHPPVKWPVQASLVSVTIRLLNFPEKWKNALFLQNVAYFRHCFEKSVKSWEKWFSADLEATFN